MLMKRLLMICALAVIAASAFAQAKNVKKVKNYIENSETPIATDLSNAKPGMIDEYRALLEPALTDPESKDLPDTWRYAARLKIYDMNQLLKEYAANGNQFKDVNAFFQNQYDIVQYYENYERCMHIPNEKGKLPYKEEEMQKEHLFAQQVATGPRNNLVVGASNLIYTDAPFTIKLLELYYETFDNPLFKELDLRNKDENQALANFIYATALKETGTNEEKRMELLKESLDGENGPLALQDLVTYYKEKEDYATMRQYLRLGTEKFPKQLIFHLNLVQDELRNHEDEAADADAKKAIAIIESDEQLKADENAAWLYYFDAIALYNQEKLEPAYDMFVKAYHHEANFDNLSGAANCAAKLAIENYTKKDVAKKWYDKAIAHYEQCRADYPDQEDVWGYQLYACYNNTGNTAKAAQFKKYCTKK